MKNISIIQRTVTWIVVLVLAITLVFANRLPDAYGESLPTITGKCTTKLTKHFLWGNAPKYNAAFDVTFPNGQVYEGWCIDHKDYAPADGTYNFVGTLNSEGTYDVIVNSNYPVNGKNSVHYMDQKVWGASGAGNNTQRIGQLKYSPKGVISLLKKSKVERNEKGEAFNLSGAEYGVYHDKNMTKLAGILVSGENGESNKLELPVGVYYIKEEKAPEGFQINAEIYEVTLEEGKPIVVTAYDEPNAHIETVAFFHTGLKEGVREKKSIIHDKVNYENLVPGDEYVIKGKLLNRDNAKEVVAEAEKKFTPTVSNGTELIEFKTNGCEYKGSRLVAVEELYKNDKIVGSHMDLECDEQTVVFPSLRTMATDYKDKDKTLKDEDNVTIVDKVQYENLIPGNEYEIKGIIMDKDTGKPLLIKGKEIKAEKRFKATKADGFEELKFTFDARSLGGRDVVVFERIYREGIEIAAHADINDKDQSLTIEKTPVKSPKTGDRININPLFPIAIIAAAFCLTRFKKDKRDNLPGKQS